jgi:hypothetical protein
VAEKPPEEQRIVLPGDKQPPQRSLNESAHKLYR